MLELPSVLDADRVAYEAERDIDRQFVVHTDFIKIGMPEASADRLDLKLLYQGELFQRLLSFDEQFDEDVFLLGLYDLQKIGRIDREGNRLLTAAVEHSGDQSRLSETSGRSLAGFFAGTGL